MQRSSKGARLFSNHSPRDNLPATVVVGDEDEGMLLWKVFDIPLKLLM